MFYCTVSFSVLYLQEAGRDRLTSPPLQHLLLLHLRPLGPVEFDTLHITDVSVEAQMICQLFGVRCHYNEKQKLQKKGGKQNKCDSRDVTWSISSFRSRLLLNGCWKHPPLPLRVLTAHVPTLAADSWSSHGGGFVVATLRHREPQFLSILLVAVSVPEVGAQPDTASLLGVLEGCILDSIFIWRLVRLIPNIVIDDVDPIKSGLAAQGPLTFEAANLWK